MRFKRFISISTIAICIPLAACAQAAPAASSSPPASSASSGAAASAKLAPRIGYAELSRLLTQGGTNVLLLDVRTPEEFAEGRIPGAILAPYDSLKQKFVEPDKSRPIVVYCRSGRRSAIAVETLKAMGYGNIADFGGISAWQGKLTR